MLKVDHAYYYTTIQRFFHVGNKGNIYIYQLNQQVPLQKVDPGEGWGQPDATSFNYHCLTVIAQKWQIHIIHYSTAMKFTMKNMILQFMSSEEEVSDGHEC